MSKHLGLNADARENQDQARENQEKIEKKSRFAWVVFEKNQTVLKTVQKPIIGVFPGAIIFI